MMPRLASHMSTMAMAGNAAGHSGRNMACMDSIFIQANIAYTAYHPTSISRQNKLMRSCSTLHLLENMFASKKVAQTSRMMRGDQGKSYFCPSGILIHRLKSLPTCSPSSV